MVTAALPSALTGDSPNEVGESSSSESSSEVPDDEKDHRRLDTDGDLLEEFLENEGKILRLPTGSDLDIDIDELTKVIKHSPTVYNRLIHEMEFDLDVYEAESARQEQVRRGATTNRRG